MSILYKYILGIAFILNAASGVVFAEPVRNAYVQIELVTDVTAIRPGEPFWVGVHMDMDNVWQVYWKNPGDSGLPTVIRWDLPEGFETGEVHWPFPIRMDYPELTSYGYEDQVVLISRITPPKNLPIGSIQDIKARITWLSCNKICVPGKAEVSLALPVKTEALPAKESIRELFDETMKHWPLEKSAWEVRVDNKGKYFQLYFNAPGESALTQAAFFPERDDLIDHMAVQELKKTEEGYELLISKSTISNENISQLKGVLVSDGEWQEGYRALSIDVPIMMENNEDH